MGKVTKPEEKSNNFVLSLEENAADSLSHALEHVSDKRANSIKYMILHSFHAVELFLKARLAKANHTLIYDKPEEASKDNAKTVDFKTLCNRLKAVGVKLSDESLDDLRILKEKRNTIEHHKVSLSRDDARIYVGRSVRFLEEFIEDELDQEIKDLVDESQYESLLKEFYSYEERVELAKKQLGLESPDPRDGGEYEIFECESCNEETMIAPAPNQLEVAFCYFCKETSNYYCCSRCGCFVLGLDNEDTMGICEGCLSNMLSDD